MLINRPKAKKDLLYSIIYYRFVVSTNHLKPKIMKLTKKEKRDARVMLVIITMCLVAESLIEAAIDLI